MMREWQRKLLREKNELHIQITELGEFINSISFTELHPTEQYLVGLKVLRMQEYYSALQRILDQLTQLEATV